MKYIRFQHGVFLLFSRDLIHQEVARGVRFSIAGPPVSAGFVIRCPDGELNCIGSSESMGLKADPDDKARLQEWLKSIPSEGL